MNCPTDTLLRDDYLDRRLDPAQQRAIAAHLRECPRCWLALEHEKLLRAALRDTPVAGPSAGFAARALRTASAPQQRRAWPAFAAGFAAAAVLVLVLAVTLVTTRPAQVPSVTLALDTPQDVRLVFSSAQAIDAATLVLVLPDHVELAGRPDARELQWQASLAAGRNLVVLPLVARGAGQGEIVAKLIHGSETREFRLRIGVGTAPVNDRNVTT